MIYSAVLWSAVSAGVVVPAAGCGWSGRSACCYSTVQRAISAIPRGSFELHAANCHGVGFVWVAALLVLIPFYGVLYMH